MNLGAAFNSLHLRCFPIPALFPSLCTLQPINIRIVPFIRWPLFEWAKPFRSKHKILLNSTPAIQIFFRPEGRNEKGASHGRKWPYRIRKRMWLKYKMPASAWFPIPFRRRHFYKTWQYFIIEIRRTQWHPLRRLCLPNEIIRLNHKFNFIKGDIIAMELIKMRSSLSVLWKLCLIRNAMPALLAI